MEVGGMDEPRDYNSPAAKHEVHILGVALLAFGLFVMTLLFGGGFTAAALLGFGVYAVGWVVTRQIRESAEEQGRSDSS
jgi:uncharacterized membrane protein (DUF485 family)